MPIDEILRKPIKIGYISDIARYIAYCPYDVMKIVAIADIEKVQN